MAFYVYIIVAWLDGNIKIYELPKSQDIWTGILIWIVPKAMSILIWSPYTGQRTVHSDILRWFRQDSGLFCVMFRHDSSLFCLMFRHDFGLFCPMLRQDSSLLCIMFTQDYGFFFVLCLGRIPVYTWFWFVQCSDMTGFRVFFSALVDFNVL